MLKDQSATENGSVCAVIVTFFPNQEFYDRLQSLLKQVNILVIVDNTAEQNYSLQLRKIARDNSQIHLIENASNLGIAAALNQGLKYAKAEGFAWILTLDQDTLCYPDMVAALLSAQSSCGLKPVVIGGNYLDPRSGKTKVPEGSLGQWLKQKTVITSGSLVNTTVAYDIGGFREDYFIDQVDHEFCLRLRANGYQVVISKKPVMIHSVGEPNGPRMPLLGILPSHSPLRKYYITRNSLVTVANYWRTEPLWCLYRIGRLLLGLVSMALLEKNKLAKVHAFAVGCVDAVLQRRGPCKRQWLQNS